MREREREKERENKRERGRKKERIREKEREKKRKEKKRKEKKRKEKKRKEKRKSKFLLNRKISHRHQLNLPTRTTQQVRPRRDGRPLKRIRPNKPAPPARQSNAPNAPSGARRPKKWLTTTASATPVRQSSHRRPSPTQPDTTRCRFKLILIQGPML